MGPPRAGDLRDRYLFQQRAFDDNGDRLGAWTTLASDAPDQAFAAQTIFLKGGETILDQRLQGSQPVIIKVRAYSTTKNVDNAWRVVDARDTSRVFDITTATITADRQWVELLAVLKRGQADG